MYSPDRAQARFFAQKPLMAFDSSRPFAEQKQQITAKLTELLGDRPTAVPLNPVVEYEKVYDTFTERRIVFDVEPAMQAVCLLCIPRLGKKRYPLVICLTGHSTGMHISMGRPLYDRDDTNISHSNIAVQALERGYAALCLEQRGFGERRTGYVWSTDDNGAPRCHSTAMNSLLMGRTLIGERCWDISRAIDLALTYEEIDGDRIVCTGNSGGGTATYYAACMDERIRVAMPSCSVCTFRSSITAMRHCECNYIPGIAKYMDMGDMAAAIAPRKLIVINGDEDPIFPMQGVQEAFDTIRTIYRAAGVPQNCMLTTGHGGHQYYKRNAWEAFDRIVGWE